MNRAPEGGGELLEEKADYQQCIENNILKGQT